jgi:peptide deformylase
MEITTYPNRVLKKKAKKITDFNQDLLSLIQEMKQTLGEKGVGLAAPQVGQSLRLFIIRWENQELVLINPRIISCSRNKIEAEEGCLSLPGLSVNVKRSDKIDIEAYNEQGIITRMTLEGWIARIFQHEFDHLNGILIIDRAGFWKKRKLLREYYANK